MRKRYVASKRHTIQVDFDDYLYALDKERAAGAAAARAATASGSRSSAYVLSAQPLPRALPDLQQDAAGQRARRRAARSARPRPAHDGPSERAGAARRAQGGAGLRVRRQERAVEDGYRSPLVPGPARVRGRRAPRRGDRLLQRAPAALEALPAAPPGPLRRASARSRRARSSRRPGSCFLIAYLSPLGGRLSRSPASPALQRRRRDEPLARTSGERAARPAHLARPGARRAARCRLPRSGPRAGRLAGGAPSPATRAGLRERRFERLFERLALPGFSARRALRAARRCSGALGLYELRADSLHLAGRARGAAPRTRRRSPPSACSAIGDPLLLERRAAGARRGDPVPVEALDLALANWARGRARHARLLRARRPDARSARRRARARARAGRRSERC